MLMIERHAGDGIFQLTSRIRRQAPLEGRLASCGNWNDSLSVAYYLGLPFYGSTGATAAEHVFSQEANPDNLGDPSQPDPQRISRDLAASRISYYLVWPNCRYVPPEIVTHPEISGVQSPELRIYDLSKTK
jgi:hypothetical protein